MLKNQTRICKKEEGWKFLRPRKAAESEKCTREKERKKLHARTMPCVCDDKYSNSENIDTLV